MRRRAHRRHRIPSARRAGGASRWARMDMEVPLCPWHLIAQRRRGNGGDAGINAETQRARRRRRGNGGGDTVMGHDMRSTTGAIIEAAIRIHRRLGPGLVEKVYRILLIDELRRAGLHVEAERWVPLEIDGHAFPRAFRVDLVVEGAVVVEVKSAVALTPLNWKQLLTYLRVMDLRVGLLINFGQTSSRAFSGW